MTTQHSTIDVHYLAQLARIHLSPQEMALYHEQMQGILGHITQLQGLQGIDDLEPAAHAFDLHNVWRTGDTPGPVFTSDEALSNAPQQHDQQLCVPQVV
jgi:aspartyl-tRNA(Asn)/glutamyl-tRNA(Gln) amidotransferase subunit C